ncbi:hypothetical protein RclHR1_03440006 [Rhizophagus clarus]|uniref:Protein kinase domain-containing protein n=1 Tax=Rhizophagus clarus TaxID=94130 RepID=A0A2Z6RAM7_9GLOM|nr:hypothetical protein RclHR1_03440006 [Rhizophagus clarus]
MDQTNNKLEINSDNISLSHPTQNTLKPKNKKCNRCNKVRKIVDEINHICNSCYRIKTITLSGNKVIDDFITSILNYNVAKVNLEFVPYDKFKDITFIAEGGFSKIYKATWIDGPATNKWNKEKQEPIRLGKTTVALKELNNSKNIDSKELNELKIFYNFILKYDNYYINKYFGITQNPITQNFMIITDYYKTGDLTHYITKKFFKISWYTKLIKLRGIIRGLRKLHDADIVHQDYHSGNIFIGTKSFFGAVIGDFGISKSAIESSNDDNEVYGIIPYVSPEVLQGQKYTKASDIYSFGMIMWELMTGRKPFWDRNHDTDLIIEIFDGLRPPIVTNAPEGYIELMQKCWHSDPNKRPNASEISKEFRYSYGNLNHNNEKKNPTKVINSPDIGPITNNSGAIYKSRPLSAMIKSANITRSLKRQNKESKRKLSNLVENNNEDKIVKKLKFCNNKSGVYLTKELELDIDCNIDSNTPNDNDYKVNMEFYLNLLLKM